MALVTGLFGEVPKGKIVVQILWKWLQAKNINMELSSYSWAKFLSEVTQGRKSYFGDGSHMFIDFTFIPHTLHSNPPNLTSDSKVRK